MSTKKPQSVTEYIKWMKDVAGIDINDRTRTHYESVAAKIKADIEKGSFWNYLCENMHEYNDQYLLNTGYDLLVTPRPTLLIKPYDSVVLKSFRKNVLDNRMWPKQPQSGWLGPATWYSSINDIARTLIVVKYMDGIQFIMDKLQSACEHHSMQFRSFFEARDEGYYAVHVYTRQVVEIPNITWDTDRIELSVEIQLTTQIQDVIRKLIHNYYEQKRLSGTKDSAKWQWNYKDDQFIANYLGHILHYLEGMIMEVRDRQRGG